MSPHIYTTGSSQASTQVKTLFPPKHPSPHSIATMSQKALLLPVKQGNWEVGESPIPKPGPDEVLVKIVSAALNPVDWKIQVHGYFATEFPFVSGTDAAGIVEEVGSAVTTRAKGDKM